MINSAPFMSLPSSAQDRDHAGAGSLLAVDLAFIAGEDAVQIAIRPGGRRAGSQFGRRDQDSRCVRAGMSMRIRSPSRT